MGLFSYARYFVGILIALEILRAAVTKSDISSWGVWLAVIYLFLAATFILKFWSSS